MQCIGCSGYILKEQCPFLSGDIHQLRNMVLIGNDHTAGMTLLLKEDQLADLQIADLDAKARQDLATHTITAILIFHFLYAFQSFSKALNVFSTSTSPPSGPQTVEAGLEL